MEAKKIHRAGLALAVAAAVVASGATPSLAKSRTVRVKQTLSATSADPDARGKLRFVLKGADDGILVIQVNRLDRSRVYDVVADGVKVGSIATRRSGGGSIRFRSRPRSRDERLGFDPRGATIVVRNGAGSDVLAASVADDSIDEGKIACCIPDDSGAECEDRTEAECAAEGGVATASATCLPDPCAGVPSGDDDIVCCIPNDSGPECEDRTEAECAAQGGTVVEATSCAPNPCAATTPADDEIACCVPHGGEPLECETTTPATCAALSGTPTSAASCTPNPCDASPDPNATPTPTVTPTPDDTPTPGDTPSPGDTPGDDHGGHSGHGGGDD